MSEWTPPGVKAQKPRLERLDLRERSRTPKTREAEIRTGGAGVTTSLMGKSWNPPYQSGTDRTKCASRYIRYRLGSQRGIWHRSAAAVTIIHGHRVDLRSCQWKLVLASVYVTMEWLTLGEHVLLKLTVIIRSQFGTAASVFVFDITSSFVFWQLLVVWMTYPLSLSCSVSFIWC